MNHFLLAPFKNKKVYMYIRVLRASADYLFRFLSFNGYRKYTHRLMITVHIVYHFTIFSSYMNRSRIEIKAFFESPSSILFKGRTNNIRPWGGEGLWTNCGKGMCVFNLIGTQMKCVGHRWLLLLRFVIFHSFTFGDTYNQSCSNTYVWSCISR